VTSYYDDLMLRRAGLIDTARYLKLLAKNVNNMLSMPGRRVQSVAQASFYAWVKYYRPDENTPNATVSYYAKGALVALALDLTLRCEGHVSLDDVMRRLWRDGSGGLVDEAAIATALRDVGGRDYGPELAAWVHGTDELPLRTLLEAAGVAWTEEAPTLAQRLGLRISEARDRGPGQACDGAARPSGGTGRRRRAVGGKRLAATRLDGGQWCCRGSLELLRARSACLHARGVRNRCAGTVALAPADDHEGSARKRRSWLGD
jgi:hypothetical protein